MIGAHLDTTKGVAGNVAKNEGEKKRTCPMQGRLSAYFDFLELVGLCAGFCGL